SGGQTGSGLDWMIVGGESGPHARPMHPDWARSIRDQCAAWGVPFFFKQWGAWREAFSDECAVVQDGMEPREWTPYVNPDGSSGECCWYFHPDEDDSLSNWTGQPADNLAPMLKVGKNAAGRLLDGREHNDLAWRMP
ncbi:hypothetical protein LCGC14_3032300, partial [marine sediment metagenome]